MKTKEQIWLEISLVKIKSYLPRFPSAFLFDQPINAETQSLVKFCILSRGGQSNRVKERSDDRGTDATVLSVKNNCWL